MQASEVNNCNFQFGNVSCAYDAKLGGCVPQVECLGLHIGGTFYRKLTALRWFNIFHRSVTEGNWYILETHMPRIPMPPQLRDRLQYAITAKDQDAIIPLLDALGAILMAA